MAQAFLLCADFITAYSWIGGKSKVSIPKAGDVAPEINLPCCIGERRDRFVLGDYRRKKNVALIFYVLDWTAV